MSGHSKWHSIKHKKTAVDAKKGKAFTQVANMITIAARQGGGDPEMNYRLRLAIEKAKNANMPNSNIDRALKRGTGEGGAGLVEEVRYEGYGQDGVAILVDAITDNRNRTSADVRNVFSKNGGRMAEAGAVAWSFDTRGQITTPATDENVLLAIDAGALDVEEEEGKLFIYTEMTDLKKVSDALEAAGIKVESSEIILKPKNYVKVSDKNTAGKILKLMDSLEDLEDVSSVWSNFDIPEEILKELE